MRCCSKKVLWVYAVFIIVGILLYSNDVKSDEVYVNDNRLYMKLDKEIGGYITLETERCDIESKKGEYSYKAIIENGFGGTRRACWYRAEPPERNLFPLVLIVEEMIVLDKDGKEQTFYNVGSFAQYYFKPTK